MLLNSVGWWIILLTNFVGFFILRFGMIGNGNSKELIEFVGGTMLLASFVLMFWIFGMKAGFILIPIFLFATTPLTEVLVNPLMRRLMR